MQQSCCEHREKVEYAIFDVRGEPLKLLPRCKMLAWQGGCPPADIPIRCPREQAPRASMAWGHRSLHQQQQLRRPASSVFGLRSLESRSGRREVFIFLGPKKELSSATSIREPPSHSYVKRDCARARWLWRWNPSVGSKVLVRAQLREFGEDPVEPPRDISRGTAVLRHRGPRRVIGPGAESLLPEFHACGARDREQHPSSRTVIRLVGDDWDDGGIFHVIPSRSIENTRWGECHVALRVSRHAVHAPGVLLARGVVHRDQSRLGRLALDGYTCAGCRGSQHPGAIKHPSVPHSVCTTTVRRSAPWTAGGRFAEPSQPTTVYRVNTRYQCCAKYWHSTGADKYQHSCSRDYPRLWGSPL